MTASLARNGSTRGRPTLISVVVPMRNGEAHIADQLAALAAQTYRGAWELIVVNNGCSDRSMEIVENFRERLPWLVTVDAIRRGLGRARNAGAAVARGELLAFCDADDMVAPGWLEALVDGAARADIVGGPAEYAVLNGELQRAWQSAQPMTDLQSGYGFLPYPSGGNCAIWVDVVKQIGGWDESFAFGASDIEFGWRAQLAGFRVAFVPGAVIQRRFRDRLFTISRQHFRYGMSEPYLFRRFGGRGMPRSDLAEALETWRWLARNSVRLLSSIEGRGNWLRLTAARLGRVYGSLRWRSLYL